MKKIIILLIPILLFSCSENKNSVIQKNIIEHVNEHLKYPDNAEYPTSEEFNGHISSSNENEYHVNSWVKASNAFGVLEKMDFSCDVIHQNDKYSILNFDFMSDSQKAMEQEAEKISNELMDELYESFDDINIDENEIDSIEELIESEEFDPESML